LPGASVVDTLFETVLSLQAGSLNQKPGSGQQLLKFEQELSLMFLPRAPRLIFTFLSFWLLLFSASGVFAQTETWQPATTGFATEIRVWTSGGNTFAEVRLIFPNTGYRVDWGQVTRTGNDFVADAKVERWDGMSAQMITARENTFNLGALAPGTYTFTFRSFGSVLKSQQFDPSLVAERWEPTTNVGNGQVGVRLWTTGGITTTKVELYVPDTGYRVTDWGQVSRSGNEFSVDIDAERFTGESDARTIIADHDYNLGSLSPGAYTLIIKLNGTVARTQPFTINASNAAAPKLMTEQDSARAIALDSVTWQHLFPVVTTHNFSSDQRARIMVFATDIASSDQNTAAAVTAQAEDARQNIHTMVVEYVGKVPGFDWLTQIVVRPPDALKSGGDVWVRISVHGIASSKALINIKPADANQY
jgi:hypothetical protein